uniref:ATPase AAA-type core domain-containing protein n=1 Tax=Plectus sambesii TaxID=2011161 RepID=A0A914VFU5_9BILA
MENWKYNRRECVWMADLSLTYFRKWGVFKLWGAIRQTELLVQLQRLQNSEGKQTLLICATNCPWELDAAFLRRFEKRIFVGLPNKHDRIQLLRRLLNVIAVGTLIMSLRYDP